ncbi:MAG: glycosyltransferase N-terminal domain-containing protein, partial [Bacteroidota bacterium]
MKLLRLLYHLGIHGLGAGMQIASWFHPKAKLWVEGRRQGLSYLESRRKAGDSWWWFHCASLGEFEQGRNLIEKIKAEHPQLKILLTFYSPSGYEIRKNYPQADAVMYLPLDTSRQVKAFLEMLQPAGVVFVKYELWLNMLQALRERGCPHWLISARVGADSAFLKSPLAALYREAFEGFQQIFVQDLESQRLLSAFAPQAEVQLSADTRFDRVAANRKQFQALPEIVAFVEQKTCLVGGSTWPKGERLIFEAWNRLALAERDDVCLILAPHEIHQDRIQQWIDRFPELSIRYSDIHRLSPAHRIL